MAYVKKAGYVGYGEVSRLAEPIHRFPFRDGETLADHFKQTQSKDEDRWEYAIGVKWHKTLPIDQAKFFPGAFAKPPVVCRIRDSKTAQFLEKEFNITL